MGKYIEGVHFVTEECCNCGTPFAMPSAFQRQRLEDGRDFYCPAGHAQHYTETTEQRLRREIEKRDKEIRDKDIRLNAKEHDIQRISSNYQRMRKRVANGVCPCCNRTFQNLFQHMKTQHAGYADGGVLRTLRKTFGLSQADLGREADVSPNHVSQYETGKAMSPEAKQKIETWLSLNA